MSMRSSQITPESRAFARSGAGRGLVIAAAVGCLLVAGPALAKKGGGHEDRRYCTATALLQFAACENELRDDFFKASAICINLSEKQERNECSAEAYAATQEGNALCREQREARRELCEALGEDRYDPDFDPDDFDDDFTNLNEFYPLAIGNTWEYEGGDETISVEVLDETKLIDGVTCIVVNDRVEDDGELVEDTDDWFGQRENGTVHYCGELVAGLRDLRGRRSRGSRAGRDRRLVQGGTRRRPVGHPHPGNAGRGPGLSPGVGARGRRGRRRGALHDLRLRQRPELDEFVPQELAELLCSGATAW